MEGLTRPGKTGRAGRFFRNELGRAQGFSGGLVPRLGQKIPSSKSGHQGVWPKGLNLGCSRGPQRGGWGRQQPFLGRTPGDPLGKKGP